MRKIVERLSGLLQLLALAGCLSWVLAAVIAIRHIIDTPQPQESTLPGEARLYLWRRGHIFYKTLGPQDAPALLLLHAPRLGNSAYEMRNVIDALAQHYRVYAPDLLGFGLSDHPAIAYSGDTYINLCRDFLTEVVERPATLLASGLSWLSATPLTVRGSSSSCLWNCSRMSRPANRGRRCCRGHLDARSSIPCSRLVPCCAWAETIQAPRPGGRHCAARWIIAMPSPTSSGPHTRPWRDLPAGYRWTPRSSSRPCSSRSC